MCDVACSLGNCAYFPQLNAAIKEVHKTAIDGSFAFNCVNKFLCDKILFRTLFLNGRIKFVDGLGATSGNGAGSGSMLIAWGSRAVVALKRMEANGVLWNFLENKHP